jgi:IS30 family transposase
VTGATSLYRGKPITTSEADEIRQRFAARQSIRYIAMAMGRSWSTVNRYAKGLTWVGRDSPEEYRRYFRLVRRRFRRRLKQRSEIDECMYFLAPWL